MQRTFGWNAGAFRTSALRRGISVIATVILAPLVLAQFASTTASAQVRQDSTRTDSTRRPGAPVDSAKLSAADSLAKFRAQVRIDSIIAFRRRDTIKAPIAHFEKPYSFDVDERLRFNRAQILNSEATNLSELLALVPGVTHYATGWLASAHLASYGGSFSRVRVFIDGLEMDNNDSRSSGILDLIEVHLWTLDEIVIERSAGEVRVWCRSATVNRTTAYTRTDVFTGDLNTNGFRGLYGKRFGNGALLQVNGQQFATQQGRQSAFNTTKVVGKGDGANQTLTARVGWARRKVSFDISGVVTTRDRDEQAGLDSNPPIPAYKSARREGNIRVGYGDTLQGLWSQVILSSLRTRLEGIRAAADTDTTNHSDTTRSREQKMFAIGYRMKSMQFSFTNRMRTFGGKSYNSPAVRYGFTSERLAFGAYAESLPLDSSYNAEGTVRFAPTKWAAVSLSHTHRIFSKYADVEGVARPNESQSRFEAGIHWHDKWFTGGVIKQSEYLTKPPTLLVGAVGNSVEEASMGFTFGAHGKLYKDINLDMQGVRWDKGALYRPQLSVRTDLSLTSNWLSHFPKGEFGINAHVIHELRDPITFAHLDTLKHQQVGVTSLRAQIFTTLFEIRIQRATIFYHFHNMTGQPYELVPGIVMPRQVQMYGVRWEFWN